MQVKSIYFIIFIFHLKDRGEIFTTRWKYYHTVCETTWNYTII